MNPKLRQVEARWVQHGREPALLLREPLGLSDRALFLPQGLAPLAQLCDGTRDLATLSTALELRTGVRLGPDTLQDILEQMDQALLLDNERSARAQRTALKEYREAPSRPPSLAGKGYPAEPERLASLLGGFLDAAPQEPVAGEVRGLICPHIDFDRGGPTYARVWGAVARAAQSAELIVVLGTDHMGGGLLTLTCQHYATPWGPLPSAVEIVEALALALGPQVAFADELHHRAEHSVELATVWLHYILGKTQARLVPILCGSFNSFIEGDQSPSQDPALSSAVRVLRKALGSCRSLVVAAGDLAHVGPVFGDRLPVDPMARARHAVEDRHLIEAICAGDAKGLFSQVKEEQDRRRVCGLPPIYLALRLLGESRGEEAGYEQCPGDHDPGSIVSICGVILK